MCSSDLKRINGSWTFANLHVSSSSFLTVFFLCCHPLFASKISQALRLSLTSSPLARPSFLFENRCLSVGSEGRLQSAVDFRIDRRAGSFSYFRCTLVICVDSTFGYSFLSTQDFYLPRMKKSWERYVG